MKETTSRHTSVIDAICTRRSVDTFTKQPIAEETLRSIVTTSLCAPTYLQQENWDIIVFTGEKNDAFKKAIRDEACAIREKAYAIGKENKELIDTFERAVTSAPANILLFICSKATTSKKNDYVSIGCLLEALLLAAHAEGLGTRISSGSAIIVDAVYRHLEIRSKELVAVVSVGYGIGTSGTNERNGSKVDYRITETSKN